MLIRGLMLWLTGCCVAMAAPSLAAESRAPAALLLQDVVRLQALPQSPRVSSHLQLLHTLIELDLGMTESAAQRLPHIQGSRTVLETVDQLRLLLAWRHWQQGEQELARQQLVRLPPFNGELERERLLLEALQRLAMGERGAAITLLNRQRDEGPFLSVATFDLALTLLQVGETEYALDLLQLLGNTPAEDESEERLRERANLVLARVLLARGRVDAAQGVVERVRLDGPDGSAALLLLGWIKLELAGAQAALVPWIDLSLRDGNDPAVLEGQLALPMALLRHAPDQQALSYFTAAIATYQQRLPQLDAAIGELTASQDEAHWLAQGSALGHGGSARAQQLMVQYQALQALAEHWPSPPTKALDAAPLRDAVLMRLRLVDDALAGDSRGAAWRDMYGRLGRYLAEAFEGEPASGAKRPLASAPFDAERAALNAAVAQLRPRYRAELLAALRGQRRRVAGYLDQANFMVAKLHEQALLQQVEGP